MQALSQSMTNSVCARAKRTKEQVNLVGWRGNTREWCMGLTSAPLAPVLKMVVLDLALTWPGALNLGTLPVGQDPASHMGFCAR